MVKKYQVVLAIVFLVGLSCNLSARVLYWHHPSAPGGTDPCEWSDPNNWWEVDPGDGTAVPGPDDHALIHNYDSLWPVIDSDVGTVAIVTPAWHSVYSEINLTFGGRLNASGWVRLGNEAGAMGVLNMAGGLLVTSHLQVGWDGNGQVNLGAGTLHVGILSFADDNDDVAGSGNIDIEAGRLLINGNHMEAGTNNVPNWIADGRITGYGGMKELHYYYDSVNSRTVVTALRFEAVPLNFLWRVVVNGWDRMTTIIPSERDAYLLEGAVFYVPRNDIDNTTPLYRLYDSGNSNDHMVSTIPGELGYATENIKGYPWAWQLEGATELIRDYDSSGSDHALIHAGESLYGNNQYMGVYGYRRYNNDNTDLLSLSAGGVEIKSNRPAGGVLWEWWHNGQQFVNDNDYGRQIQSALFWSGRNPTEAGSRYTTQNFPPAARQGSPLVECSNNGNTQTTRCIPVEWNPERFGGGQNNPVIWKDIRLGKDITLNYHNMGAVAKYATHLYLPDDMKSAAIEIPTGYLRAEFNRWWTYDAESEILTEVFPPSSTGSENVGFAVDYGGVIISNSSASHAMGVYGRSVEEGGSVVSYTLWNFIYLGGTGQYDSGTTKWNAVYSAPTMPAGDNYFYTWVTTGSVSEVTTHMRNLYIHLKGDVSGDGEFNYEDIVLLAGQWLETGQQLLADINDDQTVNLEDFAITAAGWLLE